MEPHIPDKLPIDISGWDTNRIMKMVSEASGKLSEYNGILTNPSIKPSTFLSPLEAKEAVISSKIEGTVTTVDEILRYDAGVISKNMKENADLHEVLNYRSAMLGAQKWILDGYPINKTLICSIQTNLLDKVRGGSKATGDIRKEQVWIGARGSSIEKATYIPPAPENVSIFLDNFFEYMKQEDPEPLLQTAILHAQFEIIHPFTDGNGRTGRILIPLLLWKRKRLLYPSFYISEYLEEHRDEYVYRLNQITKEKDWENWAYFFLEAIRTQSEHNSMRALNIIRLYEECKATLFENNCSVATMQSLDSLFSFPVFSAVQFRDVNKLQQQTSKRILKNLKNLGIIRTAIPSSGRSPEILIFEKLYNYINE